MNKIEYKEHGLYIHQNEHGPHYFIVAYFYKTPADWVASLKYLESELEKMLAQKKARVVLERWFGSADSLALVEREKLFLPKDPKSGLHSCVTPIIGMPCAGTAPDPCEGFAGIQIQAITPQEGVSLPEPIQSLDGKTVQGHKWQEEDARFFLLQNLCDLKHPESNTQQTTETLLKAEALLKKEGLDYRSVGRTWIYLDDILSWYTPFNEARSAFYRQVGIMPDIEKSEKTPPSECYLPASTGIRGLNQNGAACTIDLIASDIPQSSTFKVRRLTNRKQKDAFRYGAAFARALVLETPSYSQVQISGTAAIDETGSSILLGDTEAQIRYTLDTIEVLIAEAGFALSDISLATAFLKDEKNLPLFLRIMEERGLSDLPMVICKADVCRDDLLFELDGIAGKNL